MGLEDRSRDSAQRSRHHLLHGFQRQVMGYTAAAVVVILLARLFDII